MTNFERIKAMSEGEFAEEFGAGCICTKIDKCNGYIDEEHCHECYIKWLESEVQDEAD